MFDRRFFGALLAGTAASGGAALARRTNGKIPFYAGMGTQFCLYDLDVEQASLTLRATMALPATFQYAWPHPSRNYLYVVGSNQQPGTSSTTDESHYVLAYRVDPTSGTLTPHGAVRSLPKRALQLSVDRGGSFLLFAHNNPSGVTVLRLNNDGTIGAQVEQPPDLDCGIFAHQILATPSDKTLILITRGNDAKAGKPEEPGGIKIFGFEGGHLSNIMSIAPGDGPGFGPRHLDFHPSAPFVYVSLERENRLVVFGLKPDGTLTRDPLFQRESLADPKIDLPGQGAGPVHVHPGGQFAYQTNRNIASVDFEGKKVWNSGENNIAVYAIDGETGAPTAIQYADAHGFELRTFIVDPTGRLLIAASATSMLVHEGDGITNVSAGFIIYRIGADGKLTFVRKHAVDTGGNVLAWCGTLTMA